MNSSSIENINNKFIQGHSQQLNLSARIIQWSTRNDCILYPALLWLVTLLVFSIASHVLMVTLKTYTNHQLGFTSPIGHLQTFGVGFHSWDGLIFIHIASYGYLFPVNTPYFPLLPLLMKGVHELTTLSYATCGLLITNICYLLALVFLYQLILTTESQQTARRALLFITIFPSAFYFNALYTESITLLTTVLFFYFLQRDCWYLAMVSGFFAACAHTLGIVVMISGFCWLLRHRKKYSINQLGLRLLSLGIIASGLLSYMGFLLIRFGNPIIFLTSEQNWDRTLTIPVVNVMQNLWHLLVHYNFHHLTAVNFVSLVNILSTLMIATLLILMLLRYQHHRLLTFEMQIFVVLTFLASICSGTHHGSVESYARFMVVLFPAFIILGDQLKNMTALLYISIIMISFKMIGWGIFVTGVSAVHEALH